MKILKLELDNVYMFNNFEADFTIPRRVNNYYREKKLEVSTINAKDINIIIGPNASGKTTLSKAILLINRIVKGFTIKDEELLGINEQGEAHIKMLYVITKDKKDHFYEYSINFNSRKPTYEKLKYLLVKEGTFYYDKMNIINEHSFANELAFSFTEEFQSVVMNRDIEEVRLAKSFGYSFKHYDYSQYRDSKLKEQIPVGLLECFLKEVDHSIASVKSIEAGGEVSLNDFLITFYNGDRVILNDDLSSLGKRLSHGTIEAIKFLYLLPSIKKNNYSTIFINEQLTRIHSDLERQFLSILIEILPMESQLFFTTHNLEILKMNLPLSCYSILRENENGHSEIIHVEKYVQQKNDRDNLYKLIENDYFSTFKDFGILHDLLGDL